MGFKFFFYPVNSGSNDSQTGIRQVLRIVIFI